MAESNSVVRIPLNEIELGARLRDPNPDDVKTIQTSMEQVGLLTPISVRRTESGRYCIIYGAHRFLAACGLRDAGVDGWSAIDAIIMECDADQALFNEIDENLIRVELSPYDQAEFLEKRLDVWERKYGKAKRGGDRKSNSQFVNLIAGSKKPSFFEDVAKQTGLDAMTIRRAVNRRKNASDEVWKKLRGTDVARKGVLLDRLLKSPDPGAIIDLAESDFGGDVEAALNHKAPKEKTAPTVEKIIGLIKFAFSIWPEEHRRAFLREIKAIK